MKRKPQQQTIARRVAAVLSGTHAVPCRCVNRHVSICADCRVAGCLQDSFMQPCRVTGEYAESKFYKKGSY